MTYTRSITGSLKETPEFFGVSYTNLEEGKELRNNYSTFGMPMPGRNYRWVWLKGPTYSTDPTDVIYSAVNDLQDPATIAAEDIGYRYGFNGKEKDDEVKGKGNQQDYGMRIYDTRLGRFLSIDPITRDYPWWSPYHFAGNNPILYVDVDGLESAKKTKEGEPSMPKPDDILKVQEKINEAFHEIHKQVQKLDLPDNFKQPQRSDGTYNHDFTITFIEVFNNINDFQDIDKNKFKDGFSLLYQMLSPLTNRGSDKLIANIVRFTLVENGLWDETAVNTFRVGSVVAKGTFLVANQIISAQETGDATATKYKQNIVKSAIENLIEKENSTKHQSLDMNMKTMEPDTSSVGQTHFEEVKNK